MLQISRDLKKYEISVGPKIGPINFDSNVKAQLISQIHSIRSYKAKLNKQYEEIKNITTKDLLNKSMSTWDNIDTSKQVEILRNLGYSENEIDIILSQIRGDEDYDELKEKANDIMANYYEETMETIPHGEEVAINPYG